MSSCEPKSAIAQQFTFSRYKNRNPVQVLVGCIPPGLIIFLSLAYGRSTSDRQCVERSSFNSLRDPGDEIMTDKGFNVEDIFVVANIKLNVLKFLKKGNQFNNSVVVHDRKVSSKRVHVEREIGLMKTFKILCQPMYIPKTALTFEIICVCSTFCNFK